MSVQTYPAQVPTTARRIVGTVRSIRSDGTLVVRRGGGNDPLNDVVTESLASYIPTIGDSVAVIQEGSEYVTLGKVATSTPPPPRNVGVIRGADTGPAKQTTSLSYVQFSTVVSAQLSVGPSGWMLIGWSCTAMENDTVGQTTLMSVNVETTAGNVVFAPSDTMAITNEGTNFVGAGMSFPFFVGDIGNNEVVASLFHRVTGGSGSFQHRRLWAVSI